DRQDGAVGAAGEVEEEALAGSGAAEPVADRVEDGGARRRIVEEGADVGRTVAERRPGEERRHGLDVPRRRRRAEAEARLGIVVDGDEEGAVGGGRRGGGERGEEPEGEEKAPHPPASV